MASSEPNGKAAIPTTTSGVRTPSRSSSGVSLSTIDENASGREGAGNGEPQRLERSGSAFAGNSAILEAILAQKMTSASSLYLRSNSVHSVESAYSVHSGGGGGGSNNNLENLERCHCDDCILGITDFLADFEATKLADKKDASGGEQPPILVRKVT